MFLLPSVALGLLLALVLGGSTEIWAQAVILLVSAILIAWAPPRVYLGLVPTSVGLLFLVLGGTAFLPAGWAAWRLPPSSCCFASAMA